MKGGIDSMRIFAGLLALLLAASACTQTGVQTDNLVTRSSLEALAKGSDAIVVGVVRAELGTRNMARRPDDPRQPHQTLVITGQDYEIDVVRVLRGAPQQTIVVTAARAIGTAADGMTTHPTYIPMPTGAQYVFFLNRQIDGTTGFVPTAEPWRFKLTTVAEAVSVWPDAGKYFPSKAAPQFLSDVANAAE